MTKLKTLRQFIEIKSRWTYNSGFWFTLNNFKNFVCSSVDDFLAKYKSEKDMLDDYYVVDYDCKTYKAHNNFYGYSTLFELNIIYKDKYLPDTLKKPSCKEIAFDFLKNELMLRVEESQGTFFLGTGMGGYTKITKAQANIFIDALGDGDDI